MNHRDIWDRYTAAWKATTTEERTALFEAALAPDCVYTDPLGQRPGWDALATYMDEFHQQVPGGHFVTEKFYTHHEKGAIAWTMRDAEGASIGEGVSYAEYGADGKLKAMTGFFDLPG